MRRLEAFLRDWRLCALDGMNGTGLDEFRRLADALRDGTQRTGSALMVRTNRMSALRVLEARVLQHLVADDGQPAHVETQRALRRPDHRGRATPGSTLLFETLACSPAFNTFGGEAHWLIEGQPSLQLARRASIQPAAGSARDTRGSRRHPAIHGRKAARSRRSDARGWRAPA